MNLPKIFISATPGDLLSARLSVRDALLTIRCQPEEQTSFDSDCRTAEALLRARLRGCQALIHIAGLRYGAEPDPATLPAGTPRRSYTQMEYHLARELGLRIYTFLLSPAYPYDVPKDACVEPDNAEQNQLQASHRAFIETNPQPYESPTTARNLRTRIIALYEIVPTLAQELKKYELEKEQELPVQHELQQEQELPPLVQEQSQVRELPIEQELPVQHDSPQVQEEQELPKVQELPKEQELSQVHELPTEQELPKQELPQVQHDLPKEQELPQEQALPYEQELPQEHVQEQPKEPALPQKHQHVLQREIQTPQSFAKAVNTRRHKGHRRVAAKGVILVLLCVIGIGIGISLSQWRVKTGSPTSASTSTTESPATADSTPTTASTSPPASTTASPSPSTTATTAPTAATPTTTTASPSAISPATLAPQMTQVQAALARLQQQGDPAKAPVSQWPQERREKELAQQMKIKVEDLHALLQAGQTSPDALVQGQALLASGKAAEAGSKFDQFLQHQQSAAQRMRLAYEGKAQIAFDQVRYAEALDYRQKAAALVDKAADPLDWASAQSWVAFIQCHLSRYQEAEPLMRESIRLREQHLGANNPEGATDLHNLAQLLVATDRIKEAEPLLQQALKMDEASYGPDHAHVAIRLNNLAQLLQSTHRPEEAEPLLRRALKIDEASHGPNDPAVARDLNNLAQLLQDTRQLAEAEKLMRRVITVFEQAPEGEQPALATALNNLAELLQFTRRPDEAEPLLRRALELDEATFGPKHPAVAIRLNHLAALFLTTKRLREAEPLMRRQAGIFFADQARTGQRHQHEVTAVTNYLFLSRGLHTPDAETHRRLDLQRQEAGLEPAAFEKLWLQVLAANPL